MAKKLVNTLFVILLGTCFISCGTNTGNADSTSEQNTVSESTETNTESSGWNEAHTVFYTVYGAELTSAEYEELADMMKTDYPDEQDLEAQMGLLSWADIHRMRKEVDRDKIIQMVLLQYLDLWQYPYEKADNQYLYDIVDLDGYSLLVDYNMEDGSSAKDFDYEAAFQKASIVDSETMEVLCQLKDMDEEKLEKLFDEDISVMQFHTEQAE
jgi:hypothetical protein